MRLRDGRNGLTEAVKRKPGSGVSRLCELRSFGVNSITTACYSCKQLSAALQYMKNVTKASVSMTGLFASLRAKILPSSQKVDAIMCIVLFRATREVSPGGGSQILRDPARERRPRLQTHVRVREIGTETPLFQSSRKCILKAIGT